MTFTAAHANVGLWQFNREANELWATDHSRKIFGLESDVPLTRETFLAAIHPEDREIAISSIRQAWNVDQPSVGDVRVVPHDDKVRWIRVRARSHPDSRGVVNRLSGIFVDISEQKRAEAEATLQRQQVGHLMRVSVLGELSGAIAHEINQPLTAILSNAQAVKHLLTKQPLDLAEIRDAVQDIINEDNRAGEVIRRLRRLLKKGETVYELVDLNDLVKSTIALLHNELIDRRIIVQVELPQVPPKIWGDLVQLQQLLLNLVMNAMEAMAETPPANKSLTLSMQSTPAGNIELCVADCGVGLKPAEQSRVFEPFYTTKDHGLGLGLAICSTIVQSHGGELTLRNNSTGGAVARFWLPAQDVFVAAK